MTASGRAWLAGVVWLGLGIATGTVMLTIMAVLMFLFALLSRPDRHPSRGQETVRGPR